MSIITIARTFSVATGSLAIALSLVLNATFATDTTGSVPEPAALTLLGVAGVAGIATGLVRRRRK